MAGRPPPEGRRPGGRQIINRPDDWRPGDGPPWSVPSPPVRAADAVRALQAEPWPDDPDTSHDDRPAAVLVLLADGPDGAELLLTRRPWHMRTHKGEVTFPGGKLDPGETYEQAALREAWEEVGLPPETVTVQGRLHPVRPLINNNWIMPVFATIPAPVELVGHAAEVDRVFWVPLHDFTTPGTYSEEYWDIGHGAHPISFYDLDDETLWGLSGRILKWLLEVVYDIPGRTPPPIIEPMP